MEYQNTFNYMKCSIEFGLSQSLKASGIKKINCIDDFIDGQKREILYTFFDESNRDLKQELSDHLLDSLSNEPITFVERILRMSAEKNTESTLIRYIWILVLKDLEEIFDKAVDASSKDKVKMSESSEHRLFDNRERSADMRQQLEGWVMAEEDEYIMPSDYDFVTVKQEPDIYTKEEWENQYGLPPQAFINDEINRR